MKKPESDCWIGDANPTKKKRASVAAGICLSRRSTYPEGERKTLLSTVMTIQLHCKGPSVEID